MDNIKAKCPVCKGTISPGAYVIVRGRFDSIFNKLAAGDFEVGCEHCGTDSLWREYDQGQCEEDLGESR